MTVREVYAGGSRYRVTGTGYDPAGAILDTIGQAVSEPDVALGDLLATVALANNATLQRLDGSWRVVGDPTEGALLTLAAKGGVSREVVVSSHQVVKELPFDSDRKRMTIVALDQSGREVVHSKGSADVLLPLCSAVETRDGRAPLDEAGRRRILDEAERMSGQALRVLRGGAAWELGTHRDSETPAEHAAHDVSGRPSLEIEEGLTFLGLVGMIDPPRDGVKEAVRLCAEGHVRAVSAITGRRSAQADRGRDRARARLLGRVGHRIDRGRSSRSCRTRSSTSGSNRCASSRASPPSRSCASWGRSSAAGTWWR